jgi:hypothetical protein
MLALSAPRTLTSRADTNAAQIGPAHIVTFISGPLTPIFSGRVEVIAQVYAVDDAASDSNIKVFLSRDPVNSTGAPGGTPIGATGPRTGSDAVSGDVLGTLSWIDTVTKGVAHQWGITLDLTAAAGNTLTISALSAAITLKELPA